MFPPRSSALERLLELDPGDRPALDRLAELARKRGEAARAVELENKKAEIDRLAARYVQLYSRRNMCATPKSRPVWPHGSAGRSRPASS